MHYVENPFKNTSNPFIIELATWTYLFAKHILSLHWIILIHCASLWQKLVCILYHPQKTLWVSCKLNRYFCTTQSIFFQREMQVLKCVPGVCVGDKNRSVNYLSSLLKGCENLPKSQRTRSLDFYELAARLQLNRANLCCPWCCSGCCFVHETPFVLLGCSSASVRGMGLTWSQRPLAFSLLCDYLATTSMDKI